MGLKGVCTNTRNLIVSSQGLLESPCEGGIKPPGFIGHGVFTNIVQIFRELATRRELGLNNYMGFLL